MTFDYLYIVIKKEVMKTKKIGTTFTINPKILELLELLNDDTKNKSKLVEWLLLNYFKSIGKNVEDIIL